ncbi:MAG TPA: ring-cleaving dioxygenase [Gemmatimonadales bacterium]|nr:ring-cleaving dioxygenase [Gemmatimonadales bacterium]
MILGLHHVTATVAGAQADLDFCRDTLGLRLVKKTVNFDNHHVYHFYYGDERGSPGTIWTTFPYAGMGVPAGRHGEGQITATALSVPGGSLEYWRARLEARGIAAEDAPPRFGEEALGFLDPSGLRMELVATRRDRRTPWIGAGMDAATAVRGLHGVTLTVADPEPSARLLTELLDFRVVGEAAGRMRLGVGSGEPGLALDLAFGTGAGPARNGLGTVHHVALAVGSAEAQRGLREALLARGLQVTEVLDRQYFQSIYFREPGGILLEVATTSPGFTVDEPLDGLGRDLKLPPWEEPHRQGIEARLPPIA